MRQHIYIIGGDSPALKIGISNQPKKRLSDMQVASPIILQFRYLGRVDTREQVLALERQTHRNLAYCWSHGEWFLISPEAAVKAIIVAAVETGTRIKHIIDLRRFSYRLDPDARAARRADSWARSRSRAKRRSLRHLRQRI